MGVPSYKSKVKAEDFFSPDDYLAYLRKKKKLRHLPELLGAVITYQGSVFESALSMGFHEIPFGGLRIGILSAGTGDVAVVGGFGIGAPAAAV
ncbi:MAG: hypothetical protein PHQ23_17690, partial [Candidatus Wallbacteria bacterium]|nr:hypothetical protein [Candidatus Wallbacteria bacterium]